MKYIIILAMLITSSSTYGDTFIAEGALEIMSVNGESIQSKDFSPNIGINLIELRYQSLYVESSEIQHWVRSSPLYLIYDYKGKNKVYINHKVHLDEHEAEDFLKKPTVEVIEGNSIKEYSLLTSSKLLYMLVNSSYNNPGFDLSAP